MKTCEVGETATLWANGCKQSACKDCEGTCVDSQKGVAIKSYQDSREEPPTQSCEGGLQLPMSCRKCGATLDAVSAYTSWSAERFLVVSCVSPGCQQTQCSRAMERDEPGVSGVIHVEPKTKHTIPRSNKKSTGLPENTKPRGSGFEFVFEAFLFYCFSQYLHELVRTAVSSILSSEPSASHRSAALPRTCTRIYAPTKALPVGGRTVIIALLRYCPKDCSNGADRPYFNQDVCSFVYTTRIVRSLPAFFPSMGGLCIAMPASQNCTTSSRASQEKTQHQ